MGNELISLIHQDTLKQTGVDQNIEKKGRLEEKELIKLAEKRRPLFEAIEISRGVGYVVIMQLEKKYQEAKAKGDTEALSVLADTMFQIAIAEDQGTSQFPNLFERALIVAPLLLETSQKDKLEHYFSWLQDIFNVHMGEAYLEYYGNALLNSSLALAQLASQASMPTYRENFVTLSEQCISKNMNALNLESIAHNYTALGRPDLLFDHLKRVTGHGNLNNMLIAADVLVETKSFSLLVAFLSYLQNEAIQERGEVNTVIGNILVKLVAAGYPMYEKNDVVSSLFEQCKKENFFFLELCIQALVEKGDIEGARSLIKKENKPNLSGAFIELLFLCGQIQVIEEELKKLSADLNNLPIHTIEAMAPLLKPGDFVDKLTAYNLHPKNKAQILTDVLRKNTAKIDSYYLSEKPLQSYVKDEEKEAREYLLEYIPCILKDETLTTNPDFLYQMVMSLQSFPSKELVQQVLAKLNELVLVEKCTTEYAIDRFLPMFDVLSQHHYSVDVVGLLGNINQLNLENDKTIAHYSQLLKIAFRQHDQFTLSELTRIIRSVPTTSLSNSTKQLLYSASLYTGAELQVEHDVTEIEKSKSSVARELLITGFYQEAIMLMQHLESKSERNFFIRQFFYVGPKDLFNTLLPLVDDHSLLALFMDELINKQELDLAFEVARNMVGGDRKDAIFEYVSHYSEKKDTAAQLKFIRYAQEVDADYVAIALLIARGGDIDLLISLLENTTGIVTINWEDQLRKNNTPYAFIDILQHLIKHGLSAEAKKYYSLYVEPTVDNDTQRVGFQRLLAGKVAVDTISRYVEETKHAPLATLSDTDFRDVLVATSGEDGPSEELVQALVTLGIPESWYELFLRRFKKEQQGLVRQRVSPFSRETFLSCYRDILMPTQLDTLRELNCDFERIVREWHYSGPERGKMALQNVNALTSLEKQRPGCISVLSSSQTFNLSCFDRYPQEALLSMYDALGTDTKIGLVLTAKADHNGAFYENKKVYELLHAQLKNHGYQIVFSEAGSRIGASKRIVATSKIYRDSLLSFLIVSAHGSARSFDLGRTYQDVISMQDFLPKSSGTKPSIIEKLKKNYYVPGMPLLFNSCSTGLPNGIVQAASSSLGGVALGPDRPTSLKLVNAVFDTQDTLIGFDAEFRQEADTMLYAQGRLVASLKQVVETALVG